MNPSKLFIVQTYAGGHKLESSRWLHDLTSNRWRIEAKNGTLDQNQTLNARAFGGIVESTENPELILQQTIRDMRDRVPELNNSVAQVMATEKLLAKNKERLETQVVDLDSKIRASVKMGRDDIATAYIGQLAAGADGPAKNRPTTRARHAGIETGAEGARQLRVCKCSGALPKRCS